MIRIGLVDDDLNHLQLMRSFLTRYEKEEKVGISVTEFYNGLNFVEDYDGALDVVFLDIEMTHMDGMAAARNIREKDQALAIYFGVVRRYEGKGELKSRDMRMILLALGILFTVVVISALVDHPMFRGTAAYVQAEPDST